METQDRVIAGLNRGVEEGWWPELNGRRPVPFPFIYYMDDGELWYTTSVNMAVYGASGKILPEEKKGLWIQVGDDSKGNFIWRKKISAKFFSQVLCEMFVFESVSEAKKAGWNKPITEGTHWFSKKTVKLIVEKE